MQSCEQNQKNDRVGWRCTSECYRQLQEFQGGGPPQVKTDSSGARWGAFWGGMEMLKCVKP